MKDWLKEIRHQISERTTSPLLGSFLISWSLWNYKFIVILISEASISSTFRLIEKFSFPSFWHILGFGIIAPLATALAYIYLYPIPARRVYEYSLKKQKEIFEIKRKIEDETPLTLERSREIRQNMSKQIEDHYQEIERKDLEIAKLKAEILELSSQLKQKKAPKVDIQDQALPESKGILTDSEISLLERIAEEGGFLSNSSLSHLSPNEKLRIDFGLGELAKKGLVLSTMQSGKSGHKLTHEGKGFLIKARAENA